MMINLQACLSITLHFNDKAYKSEIRYIKKIISD